MGAFLTLDELVAEETARLESASASNASEGKTRVFDLHCDTLDRLVFHGDASVPGGLGSHHLNTAAQHMSDLAANAAHVSLASTQKYEWCQCFAAFIPDEVRGALAWSLFERVRDFYLQQLLSNGEKLAQVRGTADIDTAFAAGKTAGMFTVEGGSFLEDDAHAETRLDALAQAGVRMLTLTWNARNALGSGNDTSDTLTAFGRTVVHELELRKIVVDVSHLNDAGFKEVCAVAERPFAASHSNARAVCNHPRNLADWQLREISRREGVVGLNFCCDFLSDKHADPTRDDVLRQVDHILEVAGERVLALGSDYDGCEVPSWLNPCSNIDNLYQLLTNQFGQEITDRVFFENAYAFFTRQ